MNHDQCVKEVLRTKARATKLRSYLLSVGYEFAQPDEVVMEPDANTSAIIQEIEKHAGLVPLCMKIFYTHIGGLNFIGNHPAWSCQCYPDALNVFPLEYSKDELSDFMDDKALYTETYGSFRIPIAPDYFHKDGVSGGMWYGVPVPSEHPDPPLLEEPHNTTFMNYLQIALNWGGFPGLEGDKSNHSWPIDELQRICK
jgi:hypothetical protein